MIDVQTPWLDLPELRDLGANLSLARLERGFSQTRLASDSKLSQTQVSLFEAGQRLPSLDQLVRLARTLDVPIQKLLTGSDRPGIALKDLAVELRGLGAFDLWVADAAVPGAARRPEEVISLAMSGNNPDPRVVEMVPALLSWNRPSPLMLRSFARITKTTYRLAWLADVALAIDRKGGFPGGCHRGPLERFLKSVSLPPAGTEWDNLGRVPESPPKSPLWRRWRISYGVDLEDFARRARSLASTPEPPRVAKLKRARKPRKGPADGR